MLKGGEEQVDAGLRRCNGPHILGPMAGWVLANPRSLYSLWAPFMGTS